MEDEELVTAAEAARILGVSRQAVQGRLDRGSLTPVKFIYRGSQRRPMYRRADIEALRIQDSTNA